MANALVIGMGGVGSVIGQKLHSYACFERIVLADVDTTHAQRLDALIGPLYSFLSACWSIGRLENNASLWSSRFQAL